MPEVLDQLDKNRLADVRRLAIKGSQFWLQLLTAADNGYPERCRDLWKTIRDVSIETSDLLKAIGTEKRAASAAAKSSGSDAGPEASSPASESLTTASERAS